MPLVVAALKGDIGSERSDLSFETHYAMRVGLRSARGSHDAVGKIWVAYRPLERSGALSINGVCGSYSN
jgi:hypothetical protein